MIWGAGVLMLGVLDGILMNWSCSSHRERSPREEAGKVFSEGTGFSLSVFQGGGSWAGGRGPCLYYNLPILDPDLKEGNYLDMSFRAEGNKMTWRQNNGPQRCPHLIS